MWIDQQLYNQIKRTMPIPCVDLLVFDAKKHVLLLRRNQQPAAGEWWFPGGRVNFCETREEAALRKLREECGLDGGRFHEMGTYDVILPLESSDVPSHGVSTLYHVAVGSFEVAIDSTSTASEWKSSRSWVDCKLQAFVLERMREFVALNP